MSILSNPSYCSFNFFISRGARGGKSGRGRGRGKAAANPSTYNPGSSSATGISRPTTAYTTTAGKFGYSRPGFMPPPTVSRIVPGSGFQF